MHRWAMFNLTLASVVLVVCASTAVSVVADTGPPLDAPPAGFTWARVDEIPGALLKPDGWHFVYSKGKLRGTALISKEAPNLTKRFETGVRLSIVDNLTKTSFRPLARQIAGFEAQLTLRERTKVSAIETLEIGEYRGRSIHYQVMPPDDSEISTKGMTQATTNIRIYLGHEARDRLLVIHAETPTSLWPRHRNTLLQLLSSIQLWSASTPNQ